MPDKPNNSVAINAKSIEDIRKPYNHLLKLYIKMETSTVISLVALIVSVMTSAVVILTYYRDRGRIEVNASIVKNDNKFAIEIHVANVGKRPITINDAGTIGWSSGSYSAGENKFLYKTLSEAENVKILEPLQSFAHIKRIKGIGVRDHNGKLWELSKNNMYELYSFAYHFEEPNNPFQYFDVKKYAKSREKALKNYLKFIKKYKLKNELVGNVGVAIGDKYISEEIREIFKIDTTKSLAEVIHEKSSNN